MPNTISTQEIMNDRAEFIQAMRQVASSVTVVTTNGTAGRHGATVSAFCSVSADPPTILVCLMADSNIAKTTLENGRFCVNVLPASKQYLSDRFAGRHDADIQERFEGIAHEANEHNIPLLTGSTVFSCSVQESTLTGSHRIFIGSVHSVKAGAQEPLVYLDGDYCRASKLMPKQAEITPIATLKSSPATIQTAPHLLKRAV